MNLLDQFVEAELEIAQGCTEPGAVAFAVAAAAEHSKGKLQRIRLRTDGYVYKNGMTTGIPGIKKYFGNQIAAALGYFAKDPLQKKLTVLAELDDKLPLAAKIMDKIEFTVLENKKPIYIEAIIEADNIVKALIKGKHSDLYSIERDGKEVYHIDQKANLIKISEKELTKKIKKLSIEQLVELIEDNFTKSHFDLMEKAYQINSRVAESDRRKSYCGIGNSYREFSLFNDMNEVAAEIGDGVGSRMSGVPLPALASSGSGNQGITITLSVYGLAKLLFASSDEKIFKATMLAHLVSFYTKTYVGRLSALCGIFYAAAPGLLAALLYLADESEKITNGINNLYSDTSGIYCDGAKGSCAFKAITAVELAVRHFHFMNDDLNCYLPSGFVNHELDITLKNLADLANPKERTVNKTLFKAVERNFK